MIDETTLFALLACLFGLLMTWGVGANDLANVMSTAMGSRSISIRQAVIIAILFEFAGAFLAGDHVTETLRAGIIDTTQVSSSKVLIHGMLAVLSAGTTWMFFASYFGLPVSITHTIVGSIVGFGTIELGIQAMQWHTIQLIAVSWILSPLLSGIISFSLFRSLQFFIFADPEPAIQARRVLPYYLFAIGFVLSLLTVRRGITHFGLQPTVWHNIGIATVIGFGVLMLGQWVIGRLQPEQEPVSSSQSSPSISLSSSAATSATSLSSSSLSPSASSSPLLSSNRFASVEQIFGVLMLFTACAMVFAHGSNDVANAVGPMAVILTMDHSSATHMAKTAIPLWIVAYGCVGIIIGFLMFGRRVIETVGSGITALTPSRAFSATFAAAMTVVLATSTGIPVSATQTLVGGILGVGLARGIGALNMNVIRSIFMSWIITIPVGALLTVTYYYGFSWLLG